MTSSAAWKAVDDIASAVTNLHPNDKRHRSFKKAKQLVWQYWQQQALPCEGPQQRNERQHTCAEQADVGAKHHELLLQQDPCRTNASTDDAMGRS